MRYLIRKESAVIASSSLIFLYSGKRLGIEAVSDKNGIHGFREVGYTRLFSQILHPEISNIQERLGTQVAIQKKSLQNHRDFAGLFLQRYCYAQHEKSERCLFSEILRLYPTAPMRQQFYGRRIFKTPPLCPTASMGPEFYGYQPGLPS